MESTTTTSEGGTRRRWTRWAVLAAFIVFVPLLIAISGIFVWSPMNCWDDEVDIHTGRIRHTWFLLYHQVSQEVKDSPVTQSLSPDEIKDVQPEWHRVRTLSPFKNYSPHYQFHGAQNDIALLARIWRDRPFTDAAKRQSARNLLRLWQRDGSDFSASNYVQSILELAYPRSDKHGEISVEELPPLPPKWVPTTGGS